MRKDITTIFITAALLSSAAFAAEPGTQKDIGLFFLADPQGHNVYGSALKQMFPIADFASKVAIRPAEMNLLAPLVLRHALETGSTAQAGRNKVVVVLGDGTNIGCSGEAEVFDDEFKRMPGLVRLMAHGNHDSYLMGTVNSYGPVKSSEAIPHAMLDAGTVLPVDEGWWKPTDEPVVKSRNLMYRNWRDACYKPGTPSRSPGTPMNKVRWLARYAESLSAHGLIQFPAGTTPSGGLRYVGSTEPLKPLAALNYRSLGVWYRPEVGDDAPVDGYRRTWNSFLVQVVDVSNTHTLVLIDTSVCANARGGISMWKSNAGTNSCIGKEQLLVIDELLRKVPDWRHVVFAGHFPIKMLDNNDRDELRHLMERSSPSGWTYISGHTHDASSPYVETGGLDMNIGSTTDWPMESHTIRFSPTSSRITGIDSFVLGKSHLPLPYRVEWDWAGEYSELCRHIGPARALADVEPDVYDAEWVSPKMTKMECIEVQKNWERHARDLSDAQARISARFSNESDYRSFILRLAAGASLYEYRNGRMTHRKIR